MHLYARRGHGVLKRATKVAAKDPPFRLRTKA